MIPCITLFVAIPLKPAGAVCSSFIRDFREFGAKKAPEFRPVA